MELGLYFPVCLDGVLMDNITFSKKKKRKQGDKLLKFYNDNSD